MRARHKLSARTVDMIASGKGNLKFGSRLSDGGGLYLFKSLSGSLTWVFIFNRNGQRREVGLGPIRDVSLASARDKADEMRGVLANGSDPLNERRAKVEAWTFKQAADAYYLAFASGWKNDASRDQWHRWIEYCGGRGGISEVPIGALDVQGVLRVIKGVSDKPTVSRTLLSMIRRVVTYAAAHGHRDASLANPAAQELIDAILPLSTRKRLVRGHHPAMPYTEVGAFVRGLRLMNWTRARALELIILTGTRKNEVLGMTFDEVDGDIWTVIAHESEGRTCRSAVCACCRDH